MGKRKHIMIIAPLVLLVIVIIIYLFFPQIYIKIVSNNVEKLEKATVTVNDTMNGQNSDVIKITDEAQLNELHSMIKKTKNLKVNRYPRHSIIIGADRRYEILLFYSNGKVDRFGTPENPQLVYRILENKKNTGGRFCCVRQFGVS